MLKNKHVVIIGGTSGIGLEVARKAQIEQAQITLVARNRDNLAKISSELNTKFIIGDIKCPELWANQIDAPVDHLYISAGTFMGGAFLETNLDLFRPTLEDRLWGPAQLIQILSANFTSQSSVTFTGGVSTRKPNNGAWITNIATAIADQMARAFAIELAPIRFNTVAPGFVTTPMWDFLSKDELEGYKENFISKTPTRRLATTLDLAKAVISIMQNEGLNGQSIYVDGGYTI